MVRTTLLTALLEGGIPAEQVKDIAMYASVALRPAPHTLSGTRTRQLKAQHAARSAGDSRAGWIAHAETRPARLLVQPQQQG
ncbi:hypothetical protein DQ384_38280 [Sphaerisporangium album]|uniref:Uncharacterized protein n=1 Tax=Sphaerisporangium album TaxID=509200 RepID=A0A367EPK0_9ACTN|nr:hypothetical protein [Sphaerisporangium album]RCG19130.1 hypothetical protein DQ384_38280 [Sphaerisporangium album]